MFSKKFSVRRVATALAISSCLLTAVPQVMQAQGGFTLWGGPRDQNGKLVALPYRYDFGGNHGQSGERYRLRIPAKKMELAANFIVIDYGGGKTHFIERDGKFGFDEREIREGGYISPDGTKRVKRDGERVEIQTFDGIELRVRTDGQKRYQTVELREVVWDAENSFIRIVPEEAIPARSKVEIQLEGVTNPRRGIYYFKCKVQTPADTAIPDDKFSARFIGTWDITIN